MADRLAPCYKITFSNKLTIAFIKKGWKRSADTVNIREALRTLIAGCCANMSTPTRKAHSVRSCHICQRLCVKEIPVRILDNSAFYYRLLP